MTSDVCYSSSTVFYHNRLLDRNAIIKSEKNFPQLKEIVSLQDACKRVNSNISHVRMLTFTETYEFLEAYATNYSELKEKITEIKIEDADAYIKTIIEIFAKNNFPRNYQRDFPLIPTNQRIFVSPIHLSLLDSLVENKEHQKAIRRYLIETFTCQFRNQIVNRGDENCYFSDEEIKALPYKKTLQTNCPYYKGETPDGKFVVLQQRKKSQAACLSMLLSSKDRYISPDTLHLEDISYRSQKSLTKNLEFVYQVKLKETSISNLPELELFICAQKASVYVNIALPHCHYVIVDAVNEEGVEIRDPNHGWAICVEREVFEKLFHSGRIKSAIYISLSSD